MIIRDFAFLPSAGKKVICCTLFAPIAVGSREENVFMILRLLKVKRTGEIKQCIFN